MSNVYSQYECGFSPSECNGNENNSVATVVVVSVVKSSILSVHYISAIEAELY